MNQSSNNLLFWCLIAMQAAGSQVILWTGVPVYRRLLSPRTEGASPKEFAVVLAAVVVMQLAYWLDRRLQPRLRFRRNVPLGHVLLWIGEISFLFPNTFAAVIVFDRSEELEFVPWKLLMLAAILFATFCYKHQLATLGEAMIRAEADATERTVPFSKETVDAPGQS